MNLGVFFQKRLQKEGRQQTMGGQAPPSRQADGLMGIESAPYRATIRRFLRNGVDILGMGQRIMGHLTATGKPIGKGLFFRESGAMTLVDNRQCQRLRSASAGAVGCFSRETG
jgi:hypothetical protein